MIIYYIMTDRDQPLITDESSQNPYENYHRPPEPNKYPDNQYMEQSNLPYQNQGYPQNQGFQPNQGYQPNPMGQPMNMPPPPPPVVEVQAIPVQFQNHPQIILIQERYNLPCMVCGFNSGSVIRRTAGCAAFSWCVCLFIFTGVFCCWIPFCIPACMDTEIVCYRCGFVKGVVQAGCI